MTYNNPRAKLLWDTLRLDLVNNGFPVQERPPTTEQSSSRLSVALPEDHQGRSRTVTLSLRLLDPNMAQKIAKEVNEIDAHAESNAIDQDAVILLFEMTFPFELPVPDDIQTAMRRRIDLLQMVTTLNANFDMPGFTLSDDGRYAMYRYGLLSRITVIDPASVIQILNAIFVLAELCGGSIEDLATGKVTLFEMQKNLVS